MHSFTNAKPQIVKLCNKIDEHDPFLAMIRRTIFRAYSPFLRALLLIADRYALLPLAIALGLEHSCLAALQRQHALLLLGGFAYFHVPVDVLLVRLGLPPPPGAHEHVVATSLVHGVTDRFPVDDVFRVAAPAPPRRVGHHGDHRLVVIMIIPSAARRRYAIPVECAVEGRPEHGLNAAAHEPRDSPRAEGMLRYFIHVEFDPHLFQRGVGARVSLPPNEEIALLQLYAVISIFLEKVPHVGERPPYFDAAVEENHPGMTLNGLV
mmetsp:Transcript_11003/g.23849  ORF Transcript_11003/g.23849 Transcript_11003/m.23849 type:complete len:265 (-) Transcript_11003:1452-2246(-)